MSLSDCAESDQGSVTSAPEPAGATEPSPVDTADQADVLIDKELNQAAVAAARPQI
ncbi:hypothetical protein K0651_08070 [Ornithinimicrobium sp. Arc0846-15]|nr:hypothetical protein [Ornithinimicrobium laminariae]